MFLENCKFKGQWRKYQAEVLDDFDKHIKDKKINVVAAPGSGKTILGLQMICRLNQPVLVLAPTITIRNQWKERFLSAYVPEGMTVDFISDDVYNLDKFNIVTYQALHYAVNKKKFNEEDIPEEETKSKIKTQNIEYDLISQLKEKGIKTIVLDEAHHLRTEWWKSLCKVLDSLEDITTISLTATPPYDSEEIEWKKYEKVCGTIDAEISVPELVAAGDLCPHQDYVIFNEITKAERNEIVQIKNNINAVISSVVNNPEFIEMIKNNNVLNNWAANEETILSDVSYYGAIIIFLNSVGAAVDLNLVKMISGGTSIPKLTKRYLEILLENVLYTHQGDYSEHENLLGEIRKQLEILGCADRKTVMLTNIKAVRNIMAASIGKMESIDTIVQKEYRSMKENLSMVILADYVRGNYLDCDLSEINKIGVIPIFRRLLQKNICENIAVLTGQLKIIPKKIIPYIKQQLEQMNISYDGIFSDLSLPESGEFAVVKGGKQISNAIVKIVTECINLKKINIVVGTVALLGEGWDAPAVNSLILASYVGSFMLSNQMRGRAIRASKEKNKTANIWHLASLAKISAKEMDFSDLENLERRFKGFVGIGYYEDVIQDGIERLNIIKLDNLQKNYQAVNEETFRLALERNEMKSRWEKIIKKYGGENIKMTNKLLGDFKPFSKIFVAVDFKNMLIKLLSGNILLFIFLGVLSAVTELTGFVSVMSGTLFNVFIVVYYLVKIIRHVNPVSSMKQIGNAVLQTLLRNVNIVSSPACLSVETEKFTAYDEYYEENFTYNKIYLKGASVHENNLFIKCIEQIYDKVFDAKYIMKIRRKNNFKGNSYFNVPELFGVNKKTASIFAGEWNKNVCKGELVYTKSNEGRKILLYARKSSTAFNADSLDYNMKYSMSMIRMKEAANWL